MNRKKQPVRLEKRNVPERKPLIVNNMIWGIPIEFILITIIMTAIFGLIIAFMGPCTESGLWFNMPHA